MPTVSPYTAGRRKTDNCVFRLERKITSEAFTLLSALPGFSKWDNYDLVFRPVLSNVQHLMEHFPDTEWLDGTEVYPDKIKAMKMDSDKVVRMKTGPLPPMRSDGYQYKRLPREHQRRALLVSWNRPEFALLMEQRTGKTKVIIDNAAYLQSLGRLHTLIIITLNGVHRNWIENEIPEDLPDWLERECFFTRGNPTNAQMRQFTKTLEFKRGMRVFAFHVDCFSRDTKSKTLFEQALGDGKKTMVAIDESSDCIKTYDSKRTKYILKHTKQVEFKRILTGTPVPEGRPDDLFAQYMFLNEDILGYDSVTAFRDRYCITRPIEVKHGPKDKIDIIVPGCRNVEELRKAIDGCSIRVRRDECMDLPPKIYKRWPVELSQEQKRLYKELYEEFITELDSQTLTAALPITRALRLQQIVCGWWPMTEGELLEKETWKNVRPISQDNPRMKALDDILRTHPDKCIIWARFRPDLQAIQEHLGCRAVSYHGGIKDDQKAKNYRAFQHDKDINYFVANPESAGRGLTMTAATMVVYYSNSYRLLTRMQSEDRAEGDEKKRKNTLIIDLEAVGTLDTKIIQQFRKKKDVADLINGDPRSAFLLEDK